MTNMYDRFTTYLHQENKRFTATKHVIFSKILQQKGHFTAQKLYMACTDTRTSRASRASRASVYRTVAEVLECGIIRETAYGEKHKYYEVILNEKEHHHHARCLRCNTVIEITSDRHSIAPSFLNRVAATQFHIIGHEIHIYGLCRQCKP